MQNQESIGELSECLEFIRGAFPSFGLQFKTVFGLISLFKRYRMGDEIEKLLKHENIPLLDENNVTNAEYMDILHRSRGQFYAEIEQLAKLQVIHRLCNIGPNYCTVGNKKCPKKHVKDDFVM